MPILRAVADDIAALPPAPDTPHTIRIEKEGDVFTAHDTAHDIMAQGPTALEAWERLAATIAVEVYDAPVVFDDGAKKQETDGMSIKSLIEAVCAGAAKSCDFVWVEPYPYWAEQAYNGSLDAAKRLHDALLPGWRVVIRQRRDDEGGGWFVRVESADFHAVQWTAGDRTVTDVLAGDEAVGIAPEAARAFLVAILRAQEARP